MSKYDLSRRTMLRGSVGGALVGAGLPLLEAMLNTNGTALADGSDLPRRFGLFFWANGKPWMVGGHPDRWTPQGTGSAFSFSELLQPLSRHKEKLVVATGLQPHTDIPSSPDGQGDGHMRGASVALTADRPRSEGFHHPSHTFAFNRATIDQVIAQHPSFVGATPTRFRSAEVSVSRVRFHDYGHWNCISHNGPNSLNLPILDVGTLYSRFFSAPIDQTRLRGRIALVDAVREDANALKGRLGNRDQTRIDQHLEHLAAIERRLTTSQQACSKPAQPGGTYDGPNGSEPLMAKMEAMADILIAAMQCDLTRVFSMMFTSPATNTLFRAQGATTSMHQHCHDGAYEVVRKITLFHMQVLARLLDKLDAATDATGLSLLDTMVLYATSEYGEGYKHGVAEFPVLLAGKARGGLNTGLHVREPGGNLAKVHLSILQALGLPFDRYGFNGGEAQSGLSGVV